MEVGSFVYDLEGFLDPGFEVFVAALFGQLKANPEILCCFLKAFQQRLGYSSIEVGIGIVGSEADDYIIIADGGDVLV